MKKYSAAFERDWMFYVDNIGMLNFAGVEVSWRPFIKNKTEVDAKAAFMAYDSKGDILPCYEVDLLIEVIRFKKALNLQIRMWAEGYTDAMISTGEMLSTFRRPPAWVGAAIRNSIQKIVGRDISNFFFEKSDDRSVVIYGPRYSAVELFEL